MVSALVRSQALRICSWRRPDLKSLGFADQLNLSKSQLAGQTFTLSKAASGVMHFDSQGFAYDFDLTGKEYPTPDGGTTSWRSGNATTWDATNRANGKVIVTFHMTLNGNTMTVVMKAAKPDGSAVEQTQTLTRVSGGPGFLGKWKSTEVKGAPTSIEISTNGSNGIVVTFREFQMSCKGAFDGKDYTVIGAGANLKETLVFERTGPSPFKMTTKLNGKPFYVDVITVSADGKTLTDDGNPISVNEPVKAVYDRQ
jgi:hypothetical protein